VLARPQPPGVGRELVHAARPSPARPSADRRGPKLRRAPALPPPDRVAELRQRRVTKDGELEELREPCVWTSKLSPCPPDVGHNALAFRALRVPQSANGGACPRPGTCLVRLPSPPRIKSPRLYKLASCGAASSRNPPQTAAAGEKVDARPGHVGDAAQQSPVLVPGCRSPEQGPCAKPGWSPRVESAEHAEDSPRRRTAAGACSAARIWIVRLWKPEPVPLPAFHWRTLPAPIRPGLGAHRPPPASPNARRPIWVPHKSPKPRPSAAEQRAASGPERPCRDPAHTSSAPAGRTTPPPNAPPAPKHPADADASRIRGQRAAPASSRPTACPSGHVSRVPAQGQSYGSRSCGLRPAGGRRRGGAGPVAARAIPPRTARSKPVRAAAAPPRASPRRQPRPSRPASRRFEAADLVAEHWAQCAPRVTGHIGKRPRSGRKGDTPPRRCGRQKTVLPSGPKSPSKCTTARVRPPSAPRAYVLSSSARRPPLTAPPTRAGAEEPRIVVVSFLGALARQ